MIKQDSWMAVVAVILAVALATVVLKAPEAESRLSVSGSATVSAVPDEVVAMLVVETMAGTAQESQEENSRLSSAVTEALKGKGVKVETTSYSVFPDYDYSRDGGRKLLGYRAMHGLKVTTTDVEGAGAVIDAAAKAGANRVDSIRFALSDERMDNVREEALARAAAVAGKKAAILAQSVGLKLGEIVAVSESFGGVAPVFMDRVVVAAEAATPVQPGEVDVTATVSLSYDI
jgi:uncharacterized protein